MRLGGMKNLWAGFLFSMALINAAGADVNVKSTLDADESVMFFPAIASELDDGSVDVAVEAWVFQQEPSPLSTFALRTYLGIDPTTEPPEQQALFAERTRYFRTDSERRERIHVRIGDEVFALPATNAAGRTHGRFNVPRAQVEWEEGGRGIVRYPLEAPHHAAHGLPGLAWIVPPDGISIVSDIDDTIKDSRVLDRKVLLRNTFLHPFRAVPGMVDWYREMARSEPGAFFHYLSASPLELHAALTAFLRDENFPQGVLHLRESTAWRKLYANQETNAAHKTGVLERLQAQFPRRKFILVGDSGERDPEIYAAFARAHPGRVLAIHIRDVTGEDRDAPRYREVFSGIAPEIWHIRH